MDEDRGDQHILMNTSLGSLGTEQMGISSTQSNHTSSKNTKQGQGNMLAMLLAENQRKDGTVSPLSPAPLQISTHVTPKSLKRRERK